MDSEPSQEHRLDDLEKLVRSLVVRVTELELGREPSRPTAPSEPLPAPPPPEPEPPPAVPPSEPTPARVLAETSFEDLLGGRILAWLGGLAIVVGVVLFLVIAVDRGWIGVEARIALAFAGSTVLLAVGLFLYERRGQTEAAVAAAGSALAALYASLTYATAVKGVVGEEAGLLVAALVGAVGATIAVRWRSQFVAALALLARWPRRCSSAARRRTSPSRSWSSRWSPRLPCSSGSAGAGSPWARF